MSAFSRTAKATDMTAPGSASEKGKEEGFYGKAKGKMASAAAC